MCETSPSHKHFQNILNSDIVKFPGMRIGTPDNSFFPMCWKCARVQMQDHGDGSKTIIGCVDEPKITSFEHAQMLCPIKKEKEN